MGTEFPLWSVHCQRKEIQQLAAVLLLSLIFHSHNSCQVFIIEIKQNLCSNNDSCYSLIFMTQCTHTYKYACTNTCIHTYCTCTKHTQTLTHAHTYAYTHTNSNMYTHIYANTYILTHAHRYTLLKIYTQIHLLSHMHIYLPNRYIHIHLSTNTEKKAMK